MEGPESSLETGSWPDLAGVAREGMEQSNNRRRERISQYYTKHF